MTYSDSTFNLFEFSISCFISFSRASLIAILVTALHASLARYWNPSTSCRLNLYFLKNRLTCWFTCSSKINERKWNIALALTEIFHVLLSDPLSSILPLLPSNIFHVRQRKTKLYPVTIQMRHIMIILWGKEDRLEKLISRNWTHTKTWRTGNFIGEWFSLSTYIIMTCITEIRMMQTVSKSVEKSGNKHIKLGLSKTRNFKKNVLPLKCS